ncbi:hypothetical protein CLOM_g3838 [Closterium sp. NIES-68]|nr:hypothetical protein CLOM_g3838 [Closterium sp. NIES-68]GJP68151.1 hypothetical protein CLOP_g24891 [Closterium sp. NIES-67]
MSCAEDSASPSSSSSSSVSAISPSAEVSSAAYAAVQVPAAVAGDSAGTVPRISAHELARRFVFTDLLGQGEFGRVWRCLDRHGGATEPLACKQILTAHLTAAQRLSLHREIAVLLRLQGHPNVLRLHAICDVDGSLEGIGSGRTDPTGSVTNPPGSDSLGSGCDGASVTKREPAEPGVYLITELCAGGDLFDLVDRFDCGVDERTAAGIFVQIARAVEWCHLHDIVHRDIKPENVLITGGAPPSSPASRGATSRRSIFAKSGGKCGQSPSYSSCSPISIPASAFCPSCPSFCPSPPAQCRLRSNDPLSQPTPSLTASASNPTSIPASSSCSSSLQDFPLLSPSSSSSASSHSCRSSSRSCSSSPFHASASSSPLRPALSPPHSNSNTVPSLHSDSPWDSASPPRAAVFPSSQSVPSFDAASRAGHSRPIPRPKLLIPRAYSAAERSNEHDADESAEACYPSLFGGPAEPEVRLADFGMECEVPPGSAIVGLAGSEPYEAPEMVEMKPYDHQADVWSLGVLLHTLLSATWPEFPDGKRELVAEDLMVPPWPSVSEDAKDLIRQMLVVDPSERLDIHCVLQHPWVVKGMRRRQRGWQQRANQEAAESFELQQQEQLKEQQQPQQQHKSHQEQTQLQLQQLEAAKSTDIAPLYAAVPPLPLPTTEVARKRRSRRTSAPLALSRADSCGRIPADCRVAEAVQQLQQEMRLRQQEQQQNGISSST